MYNYGFIVDLTNYNCELDLATFVFDLEGDFDFLEQEGYEEIEALKSKSVFVSISFIDQITSDTGFAVRNAFLENSPYVFECDDSGITFFKDEDMSKVLERHIEKLKTLEGTIVIEKGQPKVRTFEKGKPMTFHPANFSVKFLFFEKPSDNLIEFLKERCREYFYQLAILFRKTNSDPTRIIGFREEFTTKTYKDI